MQTTSCSHDYGIVLLALALRQNHLPFTLPDLQLDLGLSQKQATQVVCWGLEQELLLPILSKSRTYQLCDDPANEEIQQELQPAPVELPDRLQTC